MVLESLEVEVRYEIRHHHAHQPSLLPHDQGEAVLGPDGGAPARDLDPLAVGNGDIGLSRHDVAHRVAITILVGEGEGAPAFEVGGLGV
jgi:hypothetical protein